MLLGQHRHRLAAQVGQVGHEVVERLERASECVLQHLVEPALLGFAGVQANAQPLRLLQVVRQLGQHGSAARDMEATDADLQRAFAELPGEIERARELVRLHADQRNERPATVALQRPDNPGRLNPAIGLIICRDGYVDIWSKNLSAAAVLRKTIEAGQRIGGDRRPQPLDGVAAIVVVGRLNEDQLEGLRHSLAPLENAKAYTMGAPISPEPFPTNMWKS